MKSTLIFCVVMGLVLSSCEAYKLKKSDKEDKTNGTPQSTKRIAIAKKRYAVAKSPMNELRELLGLETRAAGCNSRYQAVLGGSSLCLNAAGNLESGVVTGADKNAIVNKHNNLRGSVSPQASNMLTMSWDAEIAAIAQAYADSCPSYAKGHDAGNARTVPGKYPSVGQNMAWGYGSWDSAIQGWYDEVNDFAYGSGGSGSINGKAVGHYTQVVWAESTKIGCGFARCSQMMSPVYICNYAPSGNNQNTQSTPYEQGTPCTNCGGSCVNNACDCGKTCYNSGTLNTGSCSCSCQADIYNPNDCSLNCATASRDQQHWACDQYSVGDCQKYANVPPQCPIKCNACGESSNFVDGNGQGSGNNGGNNGNGNNGGNNGNGNNGNGNGGRMECSASEYQCLSNTCQFYYDNYGGVTSCDKYINIPSDCPEMCSCAGGAAPANCGKAACDQSVINNLQFPCSYYYANFGGVRSCDYSNVPGECPAMCNMPCAQ